VERRKAKCMQWPQWQGKPFEFAVTWGKYLWLAKLEKISIDWKSDEEKT
jgi:hypothetical protein